MKLPSQRTFALIAIICCICLNTLLYYMQHRISNVQEKRSNTTKTILFWNTLFGNKHFYFGEKDIFSKCPVNDCYATSDRWYSDMLDFDAVVFHGNEVVDLPDRRSSRQWYVYMNLESPENRKFPEFISRDYFNLTMTYRLDSDIIWSYGVVKDIRTNEIVAPLANTTWQLYENHQSSRLVKYLRGTKFFHDNWPLNEAEEEDPKLSELIRGKEKAVSWLVSNCEATSGRQAYVQELSRHIEVDIYGKCGTLECSRSSDCFGKLVEPRYFFYLSFENSLCLDYVTEKLYHMLRYHAIPIVYGGGNYSVFAPPKSYINALDFDSPADLARYLKFLMRNPEEYGKFFTWKRYYYVEEGIERAKCRLCALLHANTPPKSYELLSDWYVKDACPLQKILSAHKYATKASLVDMN